MKKHCVIINPHSGNYFRRKRAFTWLTKLKQQCETEVFYTKSRLHACDIASDQYQNGARSFIVFGGDGTVFEVINGLFPQSLNDPITLGLFGSGTGNSMIKDFYKDPSESLDAIVQNQTKACDVAKLTCKEQVFYFTNLCSLGFVAQVGHIRNKFFSKWGHLGYILAVLCKLPSYKTQSYGITSQQTTHQKDWSLLSLNNTRYTGGNMMMAPHARYDDGKLALVGAATPKAYKILYAFPKIFSGTHIDLDYVYTEQVTQLQFDKPFFQSIMIDGEIVFATPEHFEIHPHAIRVYA